MLYKKGDIVYCKKDFIFFEYKLFEEGKSYIIDEDYIVYNLSGVSFYKNNSTRLVDQKKLKIDYFFMIIFVL